MTCRAETRLSDRVRAALVLSVLLLGSATGSARAADVPQYDIPANCKAMAEAVGTPAMQTGCVRDETDAKAAIVAAKPPPEIMSKCRADADDQASYVVLWGCIRDALAGSDVKQNVAP